MTERFYRLEVEYPAEVTPEMEMKYQARTIDRPDMPRDRFVYPAVQRVYLSKSGAEGRAALLRDYGCRVEIVRSEPVKWEV